MTEQMKDKARKPGRPVGTTKEPTKTVIIRLTEPHRIKFKELGGTRWLRRFLDEANKTI